MLLKPPKNKQLPYVKNKQTPGSPAFFTLDASTLPARPATACQSKKEAFLSAVQSTNTNKMLFVQRYDEWISDTTNDYQLLNYGPKDLLVMVAFMKLLGVEQCSLSNFSHNVHTGQSFINTIPFDKLQQKGCLISSVEEALDSIKELSCKPEAVKIRSLNRSIRRPLEHARPSIENDAQEALRNHSLDRLYSQIAHLSNEEVQPFVRQFIPVIPSMEKEQILCAKITQIRDECLRYISQPDDQSTSSFTPK